MRKHIAESAKILKREIRELDRLIKFENEKMEKVRQMFINKVRQEETNGGDLNLKKMSDSEIIDIFVDEKLSSKTDNKEL